MPRSKCPQDPRYTRLRNHDFSTIRTAIDTLLKNSTSRCMTASDK